MHIDRTTVPGSGVLHHIITREGERFGVLVEPDLNRHLYIYDQGDPDVPERTIQLEPDEADQLAEILHSQPIADRLLELERRVDELIGERGR